MMTPAQASDFLRVYALDNHNTISTNDLRQIEEVRTLLGAIMEMVEDETRAYEAKLADEETHRWEFGSHSISECRIDWCGRYRGQRRDAR
jgi:hypothetical protein